MANEVRLIDANELAERIKSYAGMFTDELGFAVSLEAVLGGIDFSETVDAVEVKHGRWERYWSEEYWTHFHSCSVCLAPALTKEETMHDEVLSNYCPNCGAKMDGDGNV